MSDENDDDKGETTFTRAQMAKMVNAQVKEKVAAELAKFGDLDELKAKAAEADKSKTQLDKMQEQLDKMATRAEASEREAMLREVADELGLSKSTVEKRLRGKTKDELLADGREYIEENGVKTKHDRQDTDENDGKQQDGNDRGTAKDDESDSPRRPAQRPAGRPREDLRSGAPRTSSGDQEENDPRKLAEMIAGA